MQTKLAKWLFWGDIKISNHFITVLDVSCQTRHSHCYDLGLFLGFLKLSVIAVKFGNIIAHLQGVFNLKLESFQLLLSSNLVLLSHFWELSLCDENGSRQFIAVHPVYISNFTTLWAASAWYLVVSLANIEFQIPLLLFNKINTVIVPLNDPL